MLHHGDARPVCLPQLLPAHRTETSARAAHCFREWPGVHLPCGQRRCLPSTSGRGLPESLAAELPTVPTFSKTYICGHLARSDIVSACLGLGLTASYCTQVSISAEYFTTRRLCRPGGSLRLPRSWARARPVAREYLTASPACPTIALRWAGWTPIICPPMQREEYSSIVIDVVSQQHSIIPRMCCKNKVTYRTWRTRSSS